jgi:hypothetical protein
MRRALPTAGQGAQMLKISVNILTFANSVYKQDTCSRANCTWDVGKSQGWFVRVLLYTPDTPADSKWQVSNEWQRT